MARLLVITAAPHLTNSDGSVKSYGPYVKEMDLWFNHFEEVVILSPTIVFKPFLTREFESSHFKISSVPYLHSKTIGRALYSFLSLPYIFLKMVFWMLWSDHIHIRCPNNYGLLGSIMQLFFPWKKKTAKYANNWDWGSKQPFTYRLQQYILRNTRLTHNMTVLVYGKWPDLTKNIKPFFTASYHESEKVFVDLELKKMALPQKIKFAFVGTLTKNKEPLFCLKVIHSLLKKGYEVELTMMGEGRERALLEQFIEENHLQQHVSLLGNVTRDKVKDELHHSHFLLFASHSEGWPKAVAESMWWGCVPITTNVSCVSYMIGQTERGSLIEIDPEMAVSEVEKYLNMPDMWLSKAQKGMAWAREYTLERFDNEIKKLII